MLKNPFFRARLDKRVGLSLTLPDLLMIWNLSTIALLALIIFSSCIFTFDCSDFLPTISYLASFSFYDRFIVFTVTAQVIPLLLFFTSTFLVYRKYLDTIDSFLLYFLSTVSALFLPSIIIFDEVYCSYYFKFDRIHVILLISIIIALSIWMILSLEWLYKRYKEMPSIRIKFIAGYIIACFISLISSISEWLSADDTGNYNRLALKEYATIVLLVFLPRIYMIEFNVVISLVKILY